MQQHPTPRRRAARLLLTSAAIVASGCGSAYRYTSLESMVAQPRDSDCEFAVMEAPPDKPYDALGVLAPDDIESGSVEEDVEAFQDTVSAVVCRSGGDGLVAERDRDGRYVRGTIIKFK